MDACGCPGDPAVGALDDAQVAAGVAAVAAAVSAVALECIKRGGCDPGGGGRQNRTHLHHIVARRAFRATRARDILEQVDIDVNSPPNLVRLPAGFHQRLHTKRYYAAVNETLAAALPYGRPGVIVALRAIARQLRRGAAVAGATA
jgi:hypothetical protein